MTLYGFHTGFLLSPKVTGAFCRGAKAPLRHISSYLENGLPDDATAVAMYGILRGTGQLYREAERRNLDFYYLDHGYFARSDHWLNWFNRSPSWFRVTKNGHSINKLTAGNDDRFRRHFEKHYPLRPWRGGKGEAIVILPPTPAIRWFFDCDDWGRQIVEQIRRFTDMPIVWREKPNAKNIDDTGNPDGTFSTPTPPAVDRLEISKASLQADLDKAAMVVCYNSNVAIEAVQQGIPVYCEEQCAAFPIRFSLESLSDPASLEREPDRWNWLAHLANNQFSMSELKSGYAFRHLSQR
ncbi:MULTISPECIES: hypothetical protein [unclassified Mesorhizobium]|uniref:hypothetical protein n=1 Tax=unclassified Mesorhizobium TaxID=325217 RepID=UPI003014CA98